MKWTVEIDPPDNEIRVASDLVIPLPNESPYGKALFPALPSRYVALGEVGHDVDVLAVWDFENYKLVGQFTGLSGIGPASPLALSPDGRFLAALQTQPGETKSNRLGVWSSETGRQVADIALPGGKFRGGFLHFAGQKRWLCLSLLRRRRRGNESPSVGHSRGPAGQEIHGWRRPSRLPTVCPEPRRKIPGRRDNPLGGLRPGQRPSGRIAFVLGH